MELLTICLIATTGVCFSVIIFFIIHLCVKSKAFGLYNKSKDENLHGKPLIQDSDERCPTDPRVKKKSSVRRKRSSQDYHFQEPMTDQRYYDEPITAKHVYKAPIKCITVNQQGNPGANFIGGEARYVNQSCENTDDELSVCSEYELLTDTDTEKFVEPKPSERCQINFTISYLETESCVVVGLGQLSGVSRPFSRGHDYIRVSTTMLPNKSRQTTKLKILGAEGDVNLGETFKFPDVTSDMFASCVIRFRLYGKLSDTFEVCVGQTSCQLADVADRSGNVVTIYKEFEKSKMKLKYLKK